MNAFFYHSKRGINFAKIRGFKVTDYMSDSEPFDGTRATGGATDENTNERAPNQKNVRQKRPLTGGNHQNQHFVRLKSFYPG